MDYSDLVFEDLIKFPELASKIFGNRKQNPKLEPENYGNSELELQTGSSYIKLEPQDNCTQKFPAKIKSEDVQTDNNQAVFYQQLPIILDSFSIHQTDLIFFTTENFNQQTQFKEASNKSKPAPDNDYQKSPEKSQNKQRKCDKCEKSFPNRKHLYFHMKIHENRIPCEICSISIKPYLLRRHKQTQHLITDEKFNCNICGKTFKRLKLLTNHEKTHDKKFECKICKNKFAHGHELNEHVSKKHENPNAFECKICEKKFNLKKVLIRHEKTHEGKQQKELKCEHCDYSSDDIRNLRRHKNKMHKKNILKIA
ncbi:hypothetical protein ACKWTF_015846 [Chironomus riparius]